MYKFTNADVDSAIREFGKKGYCYTRKFGEYYIDDIPVKMLYEHILFDKFGKDNNYDNTKSGEIQKHLKRLGYTIFKKNNIQSCTTNTITNSKNVLPKLIEPNQKLWIVGTGISNKGTETGHYYSNPGNQFWKLLYKTGITKSQYTYYDDVKLCELSIGLTDLFPYQTGADKNLDLSNFKADIDIFINDIKFLKPKLILINGKLSCCNKKQKEYIKDKINSCGYEENKTYFICYSSSGSVNKYSKERLIEWQHVADIFNSLK